MTNKNTTPPPNRYEVVLRSSGTPDYVPSWYRWRFLAVLQAWRLGRMYRSSGWKASVRKVGAPPPSPVLDWTARLVGMFGALGAVLFATLTAVGPTWSRLWIAIGCVVGVVLAVAWLRVWRPLR